MCLCEHQCPAGLWRAAQPLALIHAKIVRSEAPTEAPGGPLSTHLLTLATTPGAGEGHAKGD